MSNSGPATPSRNNHSHAPRDHAHLPTSSSPAPTVTVFKSHTIAPSPPPGLRVLPSDPSNPPVLDTASHLQTSPSTLGTSSRPLSPNLRVRTDFPGYTVTAASAVTPAPIAAELRPAPNTIGIPRTPSIKKALAGGFGSSTSLSSAPNSALSSPMLNAISDVTPLPSPLLSGDSPGPWKMLAARPASVESIPMRNDSALVTASGESISSAIANQSKRRAYHGLGMGDTALNSTVMNRDKNVEGHTRHRSISDYVPETNQGVKPRNIAVSGSQCPPTDAPLESGTVDTPMRREPHLAVQRGLAPLPRSVSQAVIRRCIYKSLRAL
jgi:protein-serine/threonine kinase